MRKYCPSCRQEKDTSEFHRNKSRIDGFATDCKQCKKLQQHDWYQGHSAAQRLRVNAIKKALQEKNRRKISDYLSTHPCVDCKEKDIIVLEFDHVRGKKDRCVSEMKLHFSWPAIEKEISKCEVRCANCHRRITHKRRMQTNKRVTA